MALRLGRAAFGQMGFEQAVEMDHHIFHFGIIDGALRSPAPGFFSRGHIGINADHVDIVEVGKFKALRIFDAATENKMQFAHKLARNKRKRERVIALLLCDRPLASKPANRNGKALSRDA